MRVLVGVVGLSRRFAALVVLGFVVLGALGLRYSAGHLGIDTDTDHLFAASLPWRQAQMEEARQFPQFDGLIVAVVKGAIPEETQETARALNAALNRDKTDFHDSSYPAGEAFYAREGLLLLPTGQLATLLSQIVAAQPFLGQLAADPSGRGLANGLSLLTQGVSAGADLTPYDGALKAVAASLRAAAAGRPEPLSWAGLIGGGLESGPAMVLAHPVLDQGDLQPGGVPTAALMRMAAALPDVKAGRVHVDYTGDIPLSDEEFASLTQGLAAGGAVSVVLIATWLFFAVRSWRLIVPILLTLAMGLVLTVSFAAVTVKVMNLISVAFAILFVGLAVDFAIQFCVRLRDVRVHEKALGRALEETARQAGGQIALAAIATSCGFLAFWPTSFIGVAELGEIAGAGMFIALICTLTFLPALLVLFQPRAEGREIGLPMGRRVDGWLKRRRGLVLGGFAVLGMAGLVAGTLVKFDANPLDTKDPDTMSMRTLSGMMDNPQTNPFYADMLAPNLGAARALGAKLAGLSGVAEVISGATFVPDDQAAKLAMLAQAQTILAPTLQAASAPPAPAPSADALRAAFAKTAADIAAVRTKLPPGAPLVEIGAAMATLAHAPDAEVLAANDALVRYLPQALAQLGESLSAQPITAANLPASVARDWFLPDGRVRVQVVPGQEAATTAGMKAFAKSVLAVDPKAGGPAVETLETARTILGAFREAALLAFIAIAVILAVVFRDAREMAQVLATLLLSCLLTALFAKLAGVEINYANIIALPLLLGVGVSFNVYFVMNYRAGLRRFWASATARAVLFSALTTGTAFGALAASADRGTASMGVLLLISLAAVLVATFLFLPALLYAQKDA
ncbi:MMPL family transporter [Acidocella sp.]|uniref:MMPL family transporter n=1 Tax=Acidocella sp. TaxID=50710 RepID=UPI00260D1F91|nr:MMPL family transporter [Acidocella sp.]